mgnify:CR=1 FL=1
MREIKFKVWHRENKKMFWFDLRWGTKQSMGAGWLSVLPDGHEREYGIDDKRLLIDPEDCEIMQFTGLKDKNGKEIYEGDIISLVPVDHPLAIVKGVVRWHPELALFEVECYSYDATFTVYSKQVDGKNTNREVIGNIYSNPELLK